ncbi:MAG: helix-turn-helix transcriptional regulator [Pseudomonadota bacterium]
MQEISHIVATLKRLLKARGMTYRELGAALDLSEPSVKRLFSSERLTLERLAQVSALLGYTLAELTQEAAASSLQLHVLTRKQETQLVSNETLLLVAVCALNHWTLAGIVAAYRLDTPACLKHLLVLDRMGLIELLPGDRIRLRIARDFDWLPDGPIRRYFLQQGLGEFVDSRFENEQETLAFAHAMLSASALAQLQLELRRLRARVAELHAESGSAPLAQRTGVGMLLAMREWEPAAFQALRRT